MCAEVVRSDDSPPDCLLAEVAAPVATIVAGGDAPAVDSLVCVDRRGLDSEIGVAKRAAVLVIEGDLGGSSVEGAGEGGIGQLPAGGMRAFEQRVPLEHPALLFARALEHAAGDRGPGRDQ